MRQLEACIRPTYIRRVALYFCRMARTRCLIGRVARSGLGQALMACHGWGRSSSSSPFSATSLDSTFEPLPLPFCTRIRGTFPITSEDIETQRPSLRWYVNPAKMALLMSEWSTMHRSWRRVAPRFSAPTCNKSSTAYCRPNLRPKFGTWI